MFLHICSFLDAGFVIRRMSLVCKQFYHILSNEQTWKIRQTKRWGANGQYPPVKGILIEKQLKLIYLTDALPNH